MDTTPEVLAPVVKPLPRLHDRGFQWLTEQFVELAKKAKKLNCAIPVITVIRDEVVVEKTWKNAHFYPHELICTGEKNVRYRTVEITGEVPRLNGWDIVAVVEHTPAGNLLKPLPNSSVTLDHKYRNTTTHLCEHCHVNRQRNDTFIVANAAGLQLQVGRSCLKDFTGHNNPAALANYANSLCSILARAASNDEDMLPRCKETYSTYVQELVAQSVAVCRVDKGYKKAASANSTSSTVIELLYPPRTSGSLQAMAEQAAYHRTQCEKYAVTTKDSQFAADAIAWAQALPADSVDYLWNLRVIASNQWLEGFRNFGLASSLANAYCNELKRSRAIVVSEVVKPASNYIGTVKSKVSVLVTITRTRCIESDWGTSTLYVMEDALGNVYNWFASAYTPYVADDKVTLTGTVKDHKEYRDEKITLLTRCKLSA